MGWRETAGVKAPSDWRKTAGIKSDDETLPPRDDSDSLDFMKPDRPVGAALNGIQQGVTLGFGDEVTGALGVANEARNRIRQAVGVDDKPEIDADPSQNPNTPAIHKSWGPDQPAGTKPVTPEVKPDQPSMADVYRRLRDKDRSTNKTSETSQPLAYGTGEFVGSASIPIPGSGLTKGAPLVARMGLGMAQAGGFGALLGAGKSEADTLDGVRDDALLNGTIAAPMGAIGGLASKAGDSLAARFGAKATEASSKADSIVQRDALKIYRKAVGGLGGEVSAGRNADQVMSEIIANPLATAEQKAAAQSLVDDPARLKMVHRVYDNAIRNFPGRLDSMQAAERGVHEAAAKNTPDALGAAREELLSDPIAKRVIPSLTGRAKRHIIPAIGTAVGGSLGVAAAHLVGVEPGYGLAAGLGAGKLLGHTSKELLSHPGVQQAVFGALESTSSGLSRLLAKSGVTISAQSSPEEKLGIIEKAASASSAVAQAIRGLTEDDPQTIEKRFNR